MQRRQPLDVSNPIYFSPLVYPGGKAWLIPRLLDIVKACPDRNSEGVPREMVEPFCGGASVGLNFALRHCTVHASDVNLKPDTVLAGIPTHA